MIIDATRMKAFLANPEFFRLKYRQNLAIQSTNQPYGLQRGTAFHRIAEEHHIGKSEAEIDVLLANEVPDAKARTVAKSMFKAYQHRYNPHGPRKIASELEFKHQIPNSPHFIAGRIDGVLDDKGKLWCEETKTAWSGAKADDLKHEWKYNAQADFEIMGARLLGYMVEGVKVRTILERRPVEIWDWDVTRTDEQLRIFLFNVHQVCELINVLETIFGVDNPWPHVANSYPCNRPGKCEYAQAGICGRQHASLTAAELAGFAPRKEHLACMEK